MLLELHIIQNFAPSNLNRDDTGTPKECEFGGHRRARISSQCIKRAIRRQFRQDALLPPQALAQRTKRLADEVARRLEQKGRDPEKARDILATALAALKIKVKEKHRTEYLLFLGENEIQAITDICHTHWDELEKAAKAAADQKKKSSRQASLPKELVNEIQDKLDGGKAADLALFGRMLADIPQKNIDAASQVAHAISTHAVGVEFDFYTAVDDLKDPTDPEEEEGAGAGMMGTIEFNSACYYRYSNVHIPQLLENLQADSQLAKATIEAFIRASVTAIPTGKQNSFAAHNPPAFVLAVIRKGQPISLANAFEKPVSVRPNQSLVVQSIHALDTHWGHLTDAYGTNGIIAKNATRVGPEPQLPNLDIEPVPLQQLITNTLDAIQLQE